MRVPHLSRLVVLLFLSWLLGCYLQQMLWLKPVLIRPADGALLNPDAVHLVWNPVPGEEIQYEVQIFQGLPGEVPATLENKEIQAPEIYVTALEPETGYFWQVRAWQEEKALRWSRAGQFKTRAYVPAR